MSEKPDTPKVMMLPPMLVLLHVIAGITLNWMVGVHFSHGWGWAGLVLLAASFATVAWARRIFLRAGTNVPPNQPALVLVREGPYRFTRNPMYLSFVIGFIGLSLLAGAPMMLLMALPLFYFLDQHVIVPEEEYLAEKFGDDYRAFLQQVRRWV